MSVSMTCPQTYDSGTPEPAEATCPDCPRPGCPGIRDDNQRPTAPLSGGCGTLPRMGHLLGYARVSTTDQQPRPPGRRPEARRLRPGVHRDGQRRPRRPARPRPGPRPPPTRRHPGRLEARPPRPLAAAPDRRRHRPGRPRGRVPEPAGVDRHDHPAAASSSSTSSAALAEFERDLIRERTTAGLAAARARGRNGGRPPVLDAGQVELARELYASRHYTTAEIARRLKVGRSTLYRYLTPE